MKLTKQLYFAPLIVFAMTIAASNTELGTPDRDDIEYPDGDPPSKLEVELGKTLYFDNRLSKNNNQSCASCHNPDLGFGDGIKFSIGTHGKKVGRNAPHIYNLAFASTFMWDGRFQTLEEQALGPIQAAGEMDMNLKDVVKRLNKVKYYRNTFKKVYKKPISAELIAKAIAGFERTLISDNSPFDRYIKGDKFAMGPGAIRGLEIFKGKGNCADCHNGVNFTNDAFHNIGIADNDNGRGNQQPKSKHMKGAFKTPGLRNVLLTAPYMHDGSLGTLEEVVDFYDKGGIKKTNLDPLIKPLKLTNQEKADLIEFLGALTDPLDIKRPKIPADDGLSH